MPLDGLVTDYVAKPLTDAEVLRRAADLIERSTWYNGKNTGEICALLAIRSAAGNARRFSCARHIFIKHIGISEFQVPSWNDAQPDGATVCAALRAAAESAS